MPKKEGTLQAVSGQFIEGHKGPGRPKGSKNQITVYKLMAEEAFRERNADRIQMVLDSIIDDALEGDKAARKLVWDSNVSKSVVQEDKSVGTKQSITVHRMSVVKGDVDNTNPLEENDNE
jgi:hypothetical protein